MLKRALSHAEWVALISGTDAGRIPNDVLRMVGEYLTMHVFERVEGGADVLDGGVTCTVQLDNVERTYWAGLGGRCGWIWGKSRNSLYEGSEFSVVVHQETPWGCWPLCVGVTAQQGDKGIVLFSDNSIECIRYESAGDILCHNSVVSGLHEAWLKGTIVTVRMPVDGSGIEFAVNGQSCKNKYPFTRGSPRENWIPVVGIRAVNSQRTYTNSVSFV